VYNRGVDKRNIFLNEKDYQRFTSLLFACNAKKNIQLSRYVSRKGLVSDHLFTLEKETIVDVIAYCLMPNHFHLLIRNKSARTDSDGIEKYMQKLSTSYAMYFNKKNQRSGSLLQGRYKAKHVHSDQYLKQVFEYIHLNPFEAEIATRGFTGLKDYAGYRYSSLGYYLGERDDFVIDPIIRDEHTYLMS